MSAEARPGFRPSRSRASLAAGSSVNNKENSLMGSPAATTKTTRRKRAMSLGGDALEELHKRTREEEVVAQSLGARQSGGLKPRRSILKAPPVMGDHAHTTNFTSSFNNNTNNASSRQADNSDSDDDDDGEQDMDITRMEQVRETRDGAEDRRKSMARRVSFAPNAHIRTFTPDKPTAQAQQLAAAAAFDHFSSPIAPSQPQSQLQSQSWSASQDEQDVGDNSIEESMEMASDEVTRAFAGHFGGSVPASLYEEEDEDENLNGPGIDEDAEDSEEEEDGNGSAAMEEVVNSNEITRFFAQEHTTLVNAQVVVAGPSALRSRKSVGLLLQDAEDEAVMASLGLAKGQRSKGPRASVLFGGVGDESSGSIDDASTEDEGDRTQAMDMTIAVESVIVVPVPVQATVGFAGLLDSDDEGDDSLVLKELALEREDNDKTMEMEPATMDYGSILAVTTPSTPTAKLRAELFARQQTTLGGASASKAPNSPKRVANLNKSPYLVNRTPLRIIESVTKYASLIDDPATPTRATPQSTLRLQQQITTLNARSPGGSLSLRGMQQQQSLFAAPTASSLAKMTSPVKRAVESSPAAIRGWTSPIKTKAIAVVVKPTEDDMTGSSYSGEHREVITSLDEFFKSTDMIFNENVLAQEDSHAKGRKSVAQFSTGAQSSSAMPNLGDLVIIAGPKRYLHDLYQAEIKNITLSMADTAALIKETESKVLRAPPKVFADWSASTGQKRVVMESQFRMIKIQSRTNAANAWNEVRKEYYDVVLDAVEYDLAGLQHDAQVLAECAFSDIVPSLEQRKAELMGILHAERQRDYELSSCDQEELQGVREAIVEQAREVERIRGEFAEFDGTLEVLRTKADELAVTESQLRVEVENLRKSSEEGRLFTTSTFHSMHSEFEALQHLHGWTLTSWTATTVQLVHVDELHVNLSLSPRGLVKSAQLEWVNQLGQAERTQNQVALTRFLFAKVAAYIQGLLNQSHAGSTHVKSIIQRIASLWLSVRRLRTELTHTQLRFPIVTSTTPQGFRIAVDVHVPTAQASFWVIVDLTGEELFEGDEDEDERRVAEPDKAVKALSGDVEIKFGRVDCDELKYIVRDTLDTFGRGGLAAACNAAEAKYEE